MADYERYLSLVMANRSLAEAKARDMLSREQLVQSERARTGILGEFGKNTPKTYEEYQKWIQQKPSETDITSPRWITLWQGDAIYGTRGSAGANIVNPWKAKEFYTSTPTFKYLSAKQAQLTEGSLFGKGPLYESYEESVLSPIIEGSAATWREAQQLISRQAARGGTSRRTAVAAAEKMRVAEQINRQKTQNLWQASLALRQYMDQAANNQIAFNQAWTNNLGFIRDQYNQAFQALSEYYGSVLLPQALALSEFQFSSAVTLDAIERQQKLLRKQKQRQLIQIGAGLALAVAGGFMAGGSGLIGTLGKTFLGTGVSTAIQGATGFNPGITSIGVESPRTQPSTPGVGGSGGSGANPTPGAARTNVPSGLVSTPTGKVGFWTPFYSNR